MSISYHSDVLHGDKQGRKISFPTINLDSKIWPRNKPPGVYACKVEINNTVYSGALYYGPRTVNHELHNVLEIFLLNFTNEIYGEKVSFQIHSFIRPVIHFKSLSELKQQIEKDVSDINKSFLKEKNVGI